MAPEAKKGQAVAYKSDMYSLGLILHFMLTRDLPGEDEYADGGKLR